MTDTNNELLHQVTCIAREYRDGILDDTLMVREMTAALSPAELGGVEAVPKLTRWDCDNDAVFEECDNGEWVKYDDVKSLLSTPRAAEAVDDAMVERALVAFQSKPILQRSNETWQTAMRAALTAALTPPSAKGENK